MYATLSTVALLAGVVAAFHEPTTQLPTGMAIRKPGLAQIVPACKPFTITWDVDTAAKTVSLQLLRGPGSDIKPLGAPIADAIANTGSFEWTPSADLEPDTLRYGLRVIDEATGQFQYSDQFGISKGDDCVSTNVTSSSSSSSSASSSMTPSATSSMASSSAPVTSSAPITSQMPYTSVPHGNFTASPTGNMTVPSTLMTAPTLSATTTGPITTGAAGHVKAAGLGMVGAIAALVVMV
jgi:hypothetical protein